MCWCICWFLLIVLKFTDLRQLSGISWNSDKMFWKSGRKIIELSENSARLANVRKIHRIYPKKWKVELKILQTFRSERCRSWSTKWENLLDFEKCCKMSIHLQRLASIQPRPSPDKFAVSFELARALRWKRPCPPGRSRSAARPSAPFRSLASSPAAPGPVMQLSAILQVSTYF